MSKEAFQRIVERAKEDPQFSETLLHRPRTILQDYDLSPAEELQVILPNFGWLIEDKIAGFSRPRSEDAFGCLKELGIKSLISLTEQPLPDEMLQRFDLDAVHIPVADFTAPTAAQIEQAVAAINQALEQKAAVGVHCGAGLGRTGTILACYLVWQGHSAEEAIGMVRAKRPGSIETPEHEAAITGYERSLRETKGDTAS